MNHQVESRPEADDDLIDIWTSAPDQAAVTAASATIERQLATDPHGAGQYLSEGLWRIVVPPLVVHYVIYPDRNVVEITNVSRTA